MIHIRVDHEELNSKRRFACGIGPALPAGDQYYFEAEGGADRHADCPACRAAVGMSEQPATLGTPLSKLSGRPGHSGYDEFVRIARSWGYD